MKSHGFFLRNLAVVVFVFSSVGVFSIELKEGENFAFETIDYTQAPIYKQIKKHPERYTFLDSVVVYRILYLSDSLKVNGLMVAPKREGKFPVVVYNRGGNRDYGQLKVSAATDILSPIAARGYVVVASNYRGNGGSDGAEEFGGQDVMDVVNLAKTCNAFSKADNSKIGLVGVSRGGMMNYLVLKNMDEYGLNVKCAITIGGITDLETTIRYHPEIGTVCEEIVPGYRDNRSVENQKRSAVFWAHHLPSDCPLLILHSYNDAAVSYAQIPVFADSLEKHNMPYQLYSFRRDNHGIVKHRLQVQSLMNNWLRVYLTEEQTFTSSERRIVVK